MNKNDLIREYKAMLDDKNTLENKIQAFLEDNTELIPLPFLLNHHLHMNCIISKFRLGNEFVTDFAYLTKSSDYWEFVLIELEDAKKRIFTKNNKSIKFHSNFNNAYDQIMSWKAYVEQNTGEILRRIDKIRVPLNDNSVIFKYVLIIGRNDEKNISEKRRYMFAQKNNESVRVMTYDSLISRYETSHDDSEKIILSPNGDQGFRVKKLPKRKISTSMFAYLSPEYLDVSDEYMQRLKKEDYQMDAWKRGNLLSYNDKYDVTTMAENTNNPLVKTILQGEKNV